jgi:hypothetical protein
MSSGSSARKRLDAHIRRPTGRPCLPAGAGARKAEPPGAVPLRDRLIPEARAASRGRSARARMTARTSKVPASSSRLLRPREDDGRSTIETYCTGRFTLPGISGAADLSRNLLRPQQIVRYRRRSLGAFVPRGQWSNPVRSVRPEPGRGRNRFRQLCQKAAGCADQTPHRQVLPACGRRREEGRTFWSGPVRDRLIPEAHVASRGRFARAGMAARLWWLPLMRKWPLRTRGDDGQT